MQTKEFARRVQASFDAAFGSGTSTVEVLGPSPDDVTATAFEVLVRPPFGASFAIPNEQLKNVPEINESAGSIAALSYQLSRDMSESVQQFFTALLIADLSVFMPDKLEPTLDEEAEASNREVLQQEVFEALGAASTCWETPEGAGVFDSTRAKELGDGLMSKIDAHVRAMFEAATELSNAGEAESDVEELKALLAQALEERDEARAALSDLQSEKEVSE